MRHCTSHLTPLAARKTRAAGAEDLRLSTVLAGCTMFCGSGSSSSGGHKFDARAAAQQPSCLTIADATAGCIVTAAFCAVRVTPHRARE